MQNETTSKADGGRRKAGTILSGLLGLALAASAGLKLSGSETMVAAFEKWNLGDMRVTIGVLEIAGAALYVFPKTASLGVLVLSSYFGGAIVAHMSHGELYVVPAILLGLVWIAQYLRRPEMLASLFDS